VTLGEDDLVVNLLLRHGFVPLKRRVGFRRKRRERDVDSRLVRVFPPDLQHPPAEIADTEQIVIGLRRQSDHEIELQNGPAVGESDPGRVENRLVGKVLSNHQPEPFGACFGGDSQTELAHGTGVLEQSRRHAARTQRRQRDRHTLLL
jgi:hypothetical protein